MVLRLFCNQVTAVRFCQGAPYKYPSVAQSGSASGLGPEGREFESLYSDQSIGGLVIMGAHVLCKHEVGVRFSYPPPSIKNENRKCYI